MSRVTANDVAEWMLRRVEEQGHLVQQRAAHEIRERFGTEYLYRGQSGAYRIDEAVLDAFRELTEGTVVWSKSNRMWRPRQEADPPDTRAVP